MKVIKDNHCFIIHIVDPLEIPKESKSEQETTEDQENQENKEDQEQQQTKPG